MTRVKIGIIGCGAVADLHHLPALKKVPILKVVSLCDINMGRAEYLKRKYHLDHVKISNDFDEIVNCSDTEAILVLTPPRFHAKICLEMAASGKHIFCEKPFTLSLVEANNVRGVIKDANVKFMIGFCYRFMSENLKLKELLRQGYIGKIRHAETYLLTDIRGWPSISKFQYKKKEGGGALFETGCHQIDLLRWCMGKVKRVRATVESRVLKSVDDKAEVTLEFQNGTTAEAHVCWVSSIYKRELAITGEKGKITIKDKDLFIYLQNKFIFGQGPLKLFLRKSKSNYQRELLYFGNCIRNDVQPNPGINDAVENMEIITAAYESSRLGKSIDI